MNLKNKNLYYVGGVVRDEILGTESFDTDYCYVGNAIDFAKSENLEILKENMQFGTVRVLVDKSEIDIASSRCETYPQKGHLPEVSNIGCNLNSDLSRRDFTINALAKNTLTNEIVDLYNGLNDIKNKVIRVLHKESFIDDPTRIVRALKFSVRFGFDLEENTRKLQDEYLKNINYDMSYHRLKKELKETFNLNKDIALKKFINENIYKLLSDNQKASLPNVSVEKLVEKYFPKHVWLVYLGNFDLKNIPLDGDEKLIIEEFNSIKNKEPKTDFEIYKMFEKLKLETVLLYAIWVNDNIAIRFLDKLKSVKISVTGNDLKALGIKQGEVFKEIFDYILSEKLKDNFIDKQKEIELIKSRFL